MFTYWSSLHQKYETRIHTIPMIEISPFYPLAFITSIIKRIQTILKDCKTCVTNGPIIE
jgi:hypothetical protein